MVDKKSPKATNLIIRADLNKKEQYKAADDLDSDELGDTLKGKITFTGLVITDDGIFPQGKTIRVDSLPVDTYYSNPRYHPSREILEQFAQQELMDHQLIRIEHHFLSCLTFVFTNERKAPPDKTYQWDEELDIVRFPRQNTGKEIKRIDFHLVKSKEGKAQRNKSGMQKAFQSALIGLVEKQDTGVKEKIMLEKDEKAGGKLSSRRVLKSRARLIDEQNFKAGTLYWFTTTKTYQAVTCCENTACNLVPGNELLSLCESCVKRKLKDNNAKYNGDNAGIEDKALSMALIAMAEGKKEKINVLKPLEAQTKTSVGGVAINKNGKSKKMSEFETEQTEDPNKTALGGITFYNDEKEKIFNLMGYFEQDDINDVTHFQVGRDEKIVGAKVQTNGLNVVKIKFLLLDLTQVESTTGRR